MKPSPTKIREAREKRGLTQHQAAGHLGISRQSVNAIERGKVKSPDVTILFRMGRVYGVGVDDLMDTDDERGTEQ